VRSITWWTISCLIKAVTSLARTVFDCTTRYPVDVTGFASFVKHRIAPFSIFVMRKTRPRLSSAGALEGVSAHVDPIPVVIVCLPFVR
jgi:hypothetical protein